MSAKKIIIIILLFSGLSVLAVVIFLYNTYIGMRVKDYPVGVGDFNDTGAYLIKPSKTLIDLNNGVNDILTPVSYESSLQSSGNDSQVKWSFSDYLKVANVVKLQTWNDEMKEWNIYGMYFYTDCNDSVNGFFIGNFIYFRPTTTKSGDVYEAREIWISSQQGRVAWGAGNYYPKPLFGWSEIDLDKIISAGDALQIAENNGGKIARLEVNNICDISLSYNPNINSDNWILAMSHYNQIPDIFEIQINPYNEKFRVIE